MTKADTREIRAGYHDRHVPWGPAPWYPSKDLYSTGNFLWVGVIAVLAWYFYKKGK